MMHLTRRKFTNILLSFFLILAFSLQACGGGSAGTGVKQFSGTLKSRRGEPVSDARVTVANTNASSISNRSGEFFINTVTDDSRVQLEIESNGVISFVTIEDSPTGEAIVDIDFVIDTSINEVADAIVLINGENSTVIISPDSLIVQSEDSFVSITDDSLNVISDDGTTVAIGNDGITITQ